MIQVSNLSISRGQQALITDLTISFKAGEFWAILGKNGTGKTTLLNTLAGFLNSHTGRILVHNQDISTFDALSKAQQISFLPQLLEASLDCTVEQSISYARYPWYQQKLDQSSEQQYIDDAIATLQLEKIKDQSIQHISGGELRKVEIATVLAQNSKILMLDEPLNHLDVAMRYHLMAHLQKLIANKIIILVTHDIQYVQQYCSHVLLLKNHTDFVMGKVSKIMTDDYLYQYLGLPIEK
jgi:iron complex transport system ATP-binding protein